MPGGRSRETKNKTVCQTRISGLKSGRGVLLRVVAYQREFLKQYFTEKQNCYFLNGRLREVVAMRQ